MKWYVILFTLLVGMVEAQSASSLARSIRANTSQLQALEANLAQKNTALAILAAEISATTLILENAQAQLQGQVSDFHVHARNTLRVAQFPWPAQVIEDVLNGVQAREAVVKQLANQQNAAQNSQRKSVQALLATRLDLQQKETTHAKQTQALLSKRAKLQRSQRTLLKKLGVKDSKLTARLRRALPQAADIHIPETNLTQAKPTPKNAPVQGMVVEHAGDGLSIQSAAAAPVIAHAAGRVIFSGKYRDFGQLIILETAPNRHDTYAGLGHRAVTLGDTVETGQILGALPNTAEPILYFEQRRGDVVLATKL